MDPLLLRILFIAAAIASGGIALLAYFIAWAAIPAQDGKAVGALGQLSSRISLRGDWRIACGVALLTLSALLVFRQLGIWWSDAIVWPLVLATFGAALLWGRSRVAAAKANQDAGAPQVERRKSSFTDLYSGVFGVLLVIGSALLFLSSNHILNGLREAAFTVIVVGVAIALILAPFLWRLGRSLTAERAERIRSQERAELAAHLHDSVLQTLALMQKRADDPGQVVMLARRQERELRDWLGGERTQTGKEGLAAALRAIVEDVEDTHGIVIELVVVGDSPIDPQGEALLAAGHEALINAARHAPESGPVRAYAEITPAQLEFFVHDRGPGFDPAAVARDRRGVSESIVGRMQRAGGRATIRSHPATGTEVELGLERKPSLQAPIQ